jgi:hypothetical protein
MKVPQLIRVEASEVTKFDDLPNLCQRLAADAERARIGAALLSLKEFFTTQCRLPSFVNSIPQTLKFFDTKEEHSHTSSVRISQSQCEAAPCRTRI